jgi:hypothetical protein
MDRIAAPGFDRSAIIYGTSMNVGRERGHCHIKNEYPSVFFFRKRKILKFDVTIKHKEGIVWTLD